MRINSINNQTCQKQNFGARFTPYVSDAIKFSNENLSGTAKSKLQFAVQKLKSLCPDSMLLIKENNKTNQYELLLSNPSVNGDIMVGSSSNLKRLMNYEALNFYAAKIESLVK